MKKYDSYKDSGIEWIGEIPSHWEIATVGRLCILGRGRVISAIEIAENEGVYPVYSSQTENYGIMGKINTYDFEGEYVTWTTDGANAGTVFYREGKFNCTNVCGTIQPKNWKQIDLKFLPYYLNLGTKFSVRLDINPKLMNNMMAKIPIAIPPKSEQTSIANFLDLKTSEIDEIIADKKRLLELYEEEKTAIINQAVTKGLDPNAPMKDSGIEWLGEIPEHWEVKKLKYIISAKLMYGANESADEENKDNPRYIRITDIGNDGNLNDETFKSLPPEKAKEYLLTEGDILFARSGATVGKTYHFKNYKGEACFAGYLIKASPIKNVVISDFLYLYTKSGAYENWKGSIFNQATIQNIGADKYAYLEVPVPAINEQQSIVHHIESECSKIDFKKARTEELIELLTEYRTALISEAVTGKIKVTED
jgi:type I restriction enzyme S subunit